MFAFAALGAALAILPAVAGSETGPTISAENYSTYYHRWTPATATVGEDGVVTFANPTEVDHGIEWVGGPSTPSCSAGVPVGKEPSASGKKWSGTCTFNAPGTYTFYCTVHGPEMTGTVIVNANGTTTTTMTMGTTQTSATNPTSGSSTTPSPSGPGSSPAGSGTPTATGPASPLGSLLAGGSSSALQLAASQHGRSVHGSIDVSPAAAGGRLEVLLLATRASLAGAGRSARIQVGRSVRTSLHAGKIAFTVSLDASARRALRARGHLAIEVKIVLSSAHASAITLSRSIVVRG